MNYIPTEEEARDGFRRYVVNGESDGTPDPSPEQISTSFAALMARIRRAKRIRVAALVALFLAAILASFAVFACGETRPAQPADAHVVVWIRNYGSRCASTHVYGAFPSAESAEAYRRKAESPKRAGVDQWLVVPLDPVR